jgi:hypothetical protein
LSDGLLLSANSRNVPIECPENYVCQSGYTEPVQCPAGISVRKPGAGAIVFLAAMLVWLVRKLRLKRLKEFSSAAAKHKEVKRAFTELVQGVSGTANSTAYWISENLVRIIDIVIIAKFSFAFYFVISQPG